MATSTPKRISATPPLVPPVPKGRVRKPSAKVLETQQALKTRNSTLRLAQNDQLLAKLDGATLLPCHLLAATLRQA